MSESEASKPEGARPGAPSLLLLSIFLISTCGLVYELIAGSLASYLLGDSVLQFSTVIGVYLFAMGVGSYLAQYLSQRGIILVFVRLQVLIGLVGGSSAAILYLAFSYTSAFRVVLYLMVFLVGLLVGMEIPLIMGILRHHLGFRELVSQVLALDYVGALVGSILFPLILVPHLGLIRTSFLCGLINVVVALFFYHYFVGSRQGFRGVAIEALLAAAALIAGLAGSDALTNMAEEALYPDAVILSRTTLYQRLVLTRRHDDIRLYLNGNLQFSSRDEYRYHEALVHPVLASCARPRRALILGGGDGLAARELLKDTRLESIDLVDLDPGMTQLFSTHPLLLQLNSRSLLDPRLHVTNADAFIWLERPDTPKFDVVIVDFPDPSNYSVGKLYTTTFYRVLQKHLNPGAVLSVQCTSPLFARRSYWCIINTIRAAGLAVKPYHLYVPSFGEWGYALASQSEPRPDGELAPGLQFLTRELMSDLFHFPADMSPVPAQINRLVDQVLVRYYDQDWRSIVE